MSYAGPEFAALEELEGVLRHLTDELAQWRRRALRAEAERSELGPGHDPVGARERIVDLEDENRALHERLDSARRRVHDLLGRLRFLEEQAAMEETTR